MKIVNLTTNCGEAIAKLYKLAYIQMVRVIVAAPDNAAVEKIEQKIKKRIPWINRHLQQTKSLILPQPKRWVAGETHRYLGRHYRLRIDRA